MSQNKTGVFKNARDKYLRFDLSQRIEHLALLISFTTLAISGLPQKWPDSAWGEALIAAMGGIERTRTIHHASAVVLIVLTVYHFLSVAYRIWVKRAGLSMLPTWQDVKDAVQLFRYNIGLAPEPPRMGRYTFGEKIEYWAVIWGTVIMILTGFMLWNPILVTDYLPGQFIPAAKAAHGAEAVLAVLSILTWHVYHAHLKHFNRSMFTGKIDRQMMEEEHPLELEAIERGQVQARPDPDVIRRRQRVFYPIAAVIAAVTLLGVYFFVTFESTAIDTVPRQEVPIYAPLSNSSPGG